MQPRSHTPPWMNETVGQRARRSPPPRSQPPVSSPLPARTRPLLSRQSETLNLTWLSLRVESVSSRGPYSAVIYTVCLGQDQKSELIAALGRPAASTVLAVLVNASQVAAHWLLSGAPDQWRSKGLTDNTGAFRCSPRKGGQALHGTVRGTDMNNSSQEHSPR